MDSLTKYNSIDAPMSAILNGICDGDDSQFENFDEVRLDFFIEFGGKEVEANTNELFDEATLRLKITTAKALMKTLEILPNEEAFNQLKSLRYHLLIPGANLTDIPAYLKQINGYVMLDVATLAEFETERKGRDKNKGQSIKMDRNYFIDLFIAINSALNLNLNENTSGRMFCRAVINYKNYAERQEALTQQNNTL